MLSSLTTRVRTFLFNDEGTIAHEQSSRKRKRIDECSENGEDDDDVAIVSVKRPKVETKSFFSRVLSSPYQKMSDWVRSKTKWNDSFFSRPKLKNNSRSTPNFEQTPKNGRLNGGQNPHVLRQEKFQANRIASISKSSEEAELRKKDTESLQDRQWQQPRQQQNTVSQLRTERVTKVTSVSTQTDDVIILNGNDRHNERGQPVVVTQRKSSTSVHFTAHNCVDYEEKEQYRQLLQKFTTAPVSPSAPPHLRHSRPKSPSTMSQRSVDSLSLGNLSQSWSQLNWTGNNRMRQATPSRPFTEIKGTSFLKRHTPAIVLLKKSAVARTPMHPQVHRVQDKDSYRTKSKSTENLGNSKSSELSNLTKYSEEARERKRKIAEQEVKSKVYEERRKAREEHLEREIQIRMKKLSIEPAFAEEPTIEEIEQEEEEEEVEKEEVFPEEPTIEEIEQEEEEEEVEKEEVFPEEPTIEEIEQEEEEEEVEKEEVFPEPAFAEEPTIEEIEQEEEEEEVEKEEVFPELTDEMDRIISNALRPRPEHEVLVEAFRLQITRKDMATLSGLNWLNDEIINFYMNLLMERGKGEGKAKVYACNTFFYPKVVGGGHSAVRRWTKRVDIFAQDYILIPVHLDMHWCLAVVDLKKKQVQYFDSMGGQNQQCLNAIKKYLCDESMDKKKQEFNLTGWSTEIVKDIPQQMNSSDCGMFACKYAEYITRGAEITFTQEHMPYFRRRMVYEILKAKLLQ